MARQGTPRKYPRSYRVNEIVREVLAEEVERLADPRLGLVTITGADVSPDLRNATIFYTTHDPHDEGTAAALRSAAPHLRGTLGRQVRLKYLPELQFREDPAIETGARVEEIIRGLRKDDDATGGD